MRFDLHSHSTTSDGTLTPTALIERARACAVTTLALTDHDATDGLAEAAVAAAQGGIALVPGVEISVTWGAQTVHIVGLNIDAGNSALQQGLAGLREFRAWRAQEVARRLARDGIEGAYEGACALATGALVSRTHFARFLVGAGYAPDVRSVFRKFLVRGKPGYVPGQWAGLTQAVEWIRGAGGQAVIAHPARYKISATRLRALLQEFRDCGGAAIEVVSGSHSRDDTLRFGQLAQKFELLASAGSDYHGPEQPYFELGRIPPLPEGCTPIWHDWAGRLPLHAPHPAA